MKPPNLPVSSEYTLARNIVAVKDKATRDRMLARVPPEQRARVQRLVEIADEVKR